MFIYECTETNFTNNGLGYLKDIISASVVDTLNGDYSLTFEYPMNAKLSEYLVEGNYVRCKVADGSYQIFMITNVIKTYETYKIQAKHVFYKLLYNFLEDVYPQNLQCQDFLNWILTHTQYNNEFVGYSNITSTTKTARYIRKNPVEAILGSDDNTMVNLYGGEIKRDNFKIYFNNRVGNDEGLKLIFGKNITGININIDNTNCYTRIMPLGYDALMLPEKYIDSSLINAYPFPRIAIYTFDDVKYDPNDEEAYHTLNDAYDALRAKVAELYDAGIDKPQVSISVDWLELSKTNQYHNYAGLERVHLGDTIYANILGVDFTTRVVKTTYNPLNDTIEKFEIGSIQATIASSMNNMVKVLKNVDAASILTQAQQNATSLITQAMGGYVYKTNSELYIMDTDNPQTAEKVWRWNINGLGYSSTGINGPYGIAMTMDGSIVADYITTGTLNTNVIQGYDSMVIEVHDATNQVAALTLTVNELNSKIQDVLDITTSGESDVGYVELHNINGSEPITIQVHPINTDLKNLYPHETLYPGATLYPHNSIVRFTNVDTSEVFDYEIPTDLLFLNSDTYDIFMLDYDERICQVVHKVGINGQGQKYALPTPVVETFTYPFIMLTTGNTYTIELVGITSGYLFVRLMAANIYTTQFATRSEVSQTADAIITQVERDYATKDLMYSEIQQTADSINLEVGKKVGKTEVISSINLTPETVKITASHVDLQGYTTFTDLATGGRSTINGSNITTGTIDGNVANITNINASNINAGTLNGNNVNITNLNASNITSGTFSANRINGGTINGNNVSMTNLSASNISGGSLTTGQINYNYYNNGWHFFRVGQAYAQNPYASALNVAYGFGGISFRNSNSADNSGSEIGYIRTTSASSPLYINANNGVNIGGIKIYDNYVHAGNLALGGNYLNADSGNLNLNTNSSHAVYANGTRIGGYSDKNTKKNIKELTTEDKEKLLNEIRELPTYKYDYKKEYGGETDNYGIIIQDFENNEILGKALHITEYLGKKKYNHEDLSQIDLILIQTLLEKIDKLEEEIKQLKEDK